MIFLVSAVRDWADLPLGSSRSVEVRTRIRKRAVEGKSGYLC